MPSWLGQGKAITLEQLRPHASDAFPFGNSEVVAALSLAATRSPRVIAVPYTRQGRTMRDRHGSHSSTTDISLPDSTLSLAVGFSLYLLLMSTSNQRTHR
jgi:hypothetical protein